MFERMRTSNPWELYESDPQFPEATWALEEAWEQAKSIAPSEPAQVRANLAERHVYRVLEQWADVGAMDSEPLWVLRNRVKRHFGVDGGWVY